MFLSIWFSYFSSALLLKNVHRPVESVPKSVLIRASLLFTTILISATSVQL